MQEIDRLYHSGALLKAGNVTFYTSRADALSAANSEEPSGLGPYCLSLANAALLAEACGVNRPTVIHQGRRWAVSVPALRHAKIFSLPSARR